MSRDGHKFKSIARRVQKEVPDLSYCAALHFIEKAEPAAGRLKEKCPEKRFTDCLFEEAMKLVQPSK